MKLSKEQQAVMGAPGHVLVKGGPGSGKTTISILRAARVAAEKLQSEQRVLFLSFARATVSRVIEAIDEEAAIASEQKKRIEVETYHSFFWSIIKAHGYLIGLPRKLNLLTPSNEAIALAGVRSDFPSRGLSPAQKTAKAAAESAKRRQLAFDKGLICFDLFASLVHDLLSRSERLTALVCSRYPYIILDEFQDTNLSQWEVVQDLGAKATILALADPEQRIFEWLGADPARLQQFDDRFSPLNVDLGKANHRSVDTELTQFGDHVLTGKFNENYKGLDLELYPSNKNQALGKLVSVTLRSIDRLKKSKPDGWSIAVLVPTKAMTRLVSDSFRSPPTTMPAINHRAVVEIEGAILAAEIIAFCLEQAPTGLLALGSKIEAFYRGKGGDSPTKRDLGTASKFEKHRLAFEQLGNDLSRLDKRNSFHALSKIYASILQVSLQGDPYADWISVRDLLEGSGVSALEEIAAEAKNLRLLERGGELRQALAQDWRENGSYLNALSAVENSFVQDHFAMTSKPEAGVVIMNMHKAKGKQFDEVILFDGWERHRNRIVRQNKRENLSSQVRQNFRVSVTRAKSRTTILTPQRDKCVVIN
ncbi:ATP-dependent helicase [Henriciella sp.]|uniref:ATP-dependent helicase n=1 Tax=Henriciella sp. TaxID=1968823 RepID=UPI00262DBA38|nr:ATP-dependent helicase [Henriciella sp.]